MSRTIKLPVVLSPTYTCQGIDAEGDSVAFDDLLKIGDVVSLTRNENADGLVIERDGTLVIVDYDANLAAGLKVSERNRADRPDTASSPVSGETR